MIYNVIVNNNVDIICFRLLDSFFFVFFNNNINNAEQQLRELEREREK